MKTRLAMNLLCALVLVLNMGCAAALLAGGAAAGAVTYINGELRTTLDRPMNAVWNATTMTMQELELTIQEQEKDALTGRIHALGATDNNIYINLKSVTENVTQIRIRINVFGDESLSRQIYRNIEENL